MRPGGVPLAALALAAVAGAPRVAAASAPSQLAYAREAGAEACPDASMLRSEVARRLGGDPFVDSADRTVHATIARRGGELRGDVQLHAGGRVRGSRTIVLGSDDCAELVRALALSVAIALDPERAMLDVEPPRAAAPPATPSTPPAPESPIAASAPAATEAARAEAPEPEPRERLVPAFGIAGGVATGVAPRAAGLAATWGDVRSGWVSIGGEVRWQPPVEGAGVRASVLAGAVVPCAHAGPLFGCAVAAVGSWRGEAAIADHAIYAAAGARVGVELPAGERFVARLAADGLATLRRVELRVDGVPVWSSPPASAALAVSLGARFP